MDPINAFDPQHTDDMENRIATLEHAVLTANTQASDLRAQLEDVGAACRRTLAELGDHQPPDCTTTQALGRVLARLVTAATSARAFDLRLQRISELQQHAGIDLTDTTGPIGATRALVDALQRARVRQDFTDQKVRRLQAELDAERGIRGPSERWTWHGLSGFWQGGRWTIHRLARGGWERRSDGVATVLGPSALQEMMAADDLDGLASDPPPAPAPEQPEAEPPMTRAQAVEIMIPAVAAFEGQVFGRIVEAPEGSLWDLARAARAIPTWSERPSPDGKSLKTMNAVLDGRSIAALVACRDCEPDASHPLVVLRAPSGGLRALFLVERAAATPAPPSHLQPSEPDRAL